MVAGKHELETGGASLEINEDDGTPYWKLWGSDWKDTEDQKEKIEFDPTTFPPGTRIVVIEPDTPLSMRFYTDPKAFYPITEKDIP